MQDNLKEKYVPHRYHTRLLKHYNIVRQDSSSVTDYIMRFDDSKLGFGVHENPEMTITHSKMGLQPEIQNEPIIYYIITLEQIYMIVQDIEK